MPRLALAPAQAAISRYKTWWRRKMETADAETKKLKKPLYHYTSAAGLLGIVEHQELWLTSIFHMNDPKELAYGTALAIDELQKDARVRSQPLYQGLARNLEFVLAHRVGKSFGIFVTSFSRKSDDLGQWRAYGDNGRGVALGIAGPQFHPKASESQSLLEKTFVAKVVYGETQVRRRQREAIRKAFDVVASTMSFLNASTAPQFLEDLVTELAVALLWNSLTSKHEAYEDEQEMRLMIVNDIRKLAPHIQSRTRGASLVPYVKVPMATQRKDVIAGVTIGPAAALEAEDATHKLLQRYGLASSSLVARSRIPYRAI